MSCRTSPLRVGRPLPGVYTGRMVMIVVGPPLVGRRLSRPTGGRMPMRLAPKRQVKEACERPPRAQRARPAGHVSYTDGLIYRLMHGQQLLQHTPQLIQVKGVRSVRLRLRRIVVDLKED